MSVYLDNAATSLPKPEKGYRVMDNYLRHIRGLERGTLPMSPGFLF